MSGELIPPDTFSNRRANKSLLYSSRKRVIDAQLISILRQDALCETDALLQCRGWHVSS